MALIAWHLVASCSTWVVMMRKVWTPELINDAYLKPEHFRLHQVEWSPIDFHQAIAPLAVCHSCSRFLHSVTTSINMRWIIINSHYKILQLFILDKKKTSCLLFVVSRGPKLELPFTETACPKVVLYSHTANFLWPFYGRRTYWHTAGCQIHPIFVMIPLKVANYESKLYISSLYLLSGLLLRLGLCLVVALVMVWNYSLVLSWWQMVQVSRTRNMADDRNEKNFRFYFFPDSNL